MALQLGAKSLFQEAKQMEIEGNHRARHGGQGASDYYDDSRRLELEKNVFYLFLIVLVVMAVGNIVSTDDVPLFTGAQYVRWIKGSDFDQSALSIHLYATGWNHDSFLYLTFLLYPTFL